MRLLRHKTIRDGALAVHDGTKSRQFPVVNGYALVPDDLEAAARVTADWQPVTERLGDYPGDEALAETPRGAALRKLKA